jgi:hypothetical protein
MRFRSTEHSTTRRRLGAGIGLAMLALFLLSGSSDSGKGCGSNPSWFTLTVQNTHNFAIVVRMYPESVFLQIVSGGSRSVDLPGGTYSYHAFPYTPGNGFQEVGTFVMPYFENATLKI